MKTLMPFKPAQWAPGGHLQTIFGYYLPAQIDLGSTVFHTIAVDHPDQVVACENAPAKPLSKKIAVLFHGLGGHADSPYMRRTATKLRHCGWTVWRVNHRGCGAGKGLAQGLYHSGRSDDLNAVLDFIAAQHSGVPIVAIGYSLSGNAILKLAGERRHPIPSTVRGIIAVNPPIDLAACSNRISVKQNWIYETRFMRLLRQAMQERRQHFPDFPNSRLPTLATLRQFDEVYTAPLNGFQSASDYYKKCSARQFLQSIALPTVILMSDDDPFIPQSAFDSLPLNNMLHLMITRGGGHVGYVASRKTPLGDRFWMDYALVEMAEWYLRD